MINYKYKDIEYVNPVDLQTVHSTLNNLETMHQEAVKTSSELKTAIANLDLNEAEEGFRQQLLNTIETTINENSKYGNLAGAYDDVVKIQGDIASNPQLISKLKAQQNYKQFIAEIDARTDLPEHYKEYYKRINPYKEGIYDENGNWIQGTKWEPTKRAALNISKDKILDTALKYITPKTGQYSVTTYMDQNGNLTNKYVEGAKLVRFNTQNTQYEEVTEQEIRNALRSAIRMNPQFMDSLKQDYDIAVDDFEDGREASFNVNNGTGKPISFEQFVDSIFADTIKTKAYRHTQTKDDFNNNLRKELNAMGLSTQPQNLSLTAAFTKPGGTSVFQDNSHIVAMRSVQHANQEIKDVIKSTGIEGLNDEFINNIDLSNPEAFKQSLSSLNLSIEDADEVTRLYNVQKAIYAEELHNDRKFRELYGDTKYYAGEKTIASIEGGKFPVEEEMGKYERRYYKQWSRLNDVYFPKGTQSIKISTPNVQTYNEFVKLAKEADLLDYFILGNEGNKKTITLDRSNNAKLIELANLYNQARDKGKEGRPWKHFWNEVGSQFGAGETIMQIKEDGSEENMLNFFRSFLAGDDLEKANRRTSTYFGQVTSYIPFVPAISEWVNYGLVPDVGNLLSPVIEFKNRMRSYGEEVGMGENRTVSNISFNAGTPEGVMADTQLNLGLYEDSTDQNAKIKTRDESTKTLFREIQTAGLRNLKVFQQDENGVSRPVVDSKDIADLERQLLNAKDTDANSFGTIELNTGLGRYTRKIKFIGDDDKPIILEVDDDHNNYLYDLNSDPNLQSIKKFHQAQVTGNDILLGHSPVGTVYAMPDGNGNFIITEEGNESNPYIVINPSIKEQKQIYSYLLQIPKYYNNIINAVAEGDEESLNKFIGEYAFYLSNVLYPDVNEEWRKQSMEYIVRETGGNLGISLE